jgi:hypothetical protein
MYSRIAGTGLSRASSGRNRRAAKRVPSGIGIHSSSISRTFCDSTGWSGISKPSELQVSDCEIGEAELPAAQINSDPTKPS